MDNKAESILRRRMHGLYLSRPCGDIQQLAHELMGLHCWFHRNVAFSALIRGASIQGWKNALTKTWLYRGTLHGVTFEDLPLLLALHTDVSFDWLLPEEQLEPIGQRVISLMEDGVYSRAEMRRIFAWEMDEHTINRVFSSWGGIFVYLARHGRVAFRNMTSRDFDLISAEPCQGPQEVLPTLFQRYFAAYGPATLADAAWFLGLPKDRESWIGAFNPEAFSRLECGGTIYYSAGEPADPGEIPELTLLSGFDPLVVSYVDRSAVLPAEYKSAVILKSGICLPTIAVNGRIAGLWNIKKSEPTVEFFKSQPKKLRDGALELADSIRQRTNGLL